jgi:Skp family chaperone for outer membrane proteins
MGKRIDTVAGVVNIASTVINAAVAVAAARRADREAKAKASNDEKDRKIRDLQDKVKELEKGRSNSQARADR